MVFGIIKFKAIATGSACEGWPTKIGGIAIRGLYRSIIVSGHQFLASHLSLESWRPHESDCVAQFSSTSPPQVQVHATIR